MTKLIKMSLAAAVAVAGLSSTAAAGSLADAVKDTSIKGKVEVGFNYEDKKSSNETSSTTKNEWEYDIDLTLNTKVNDMITAQVGFQADHDVEIDGTTSTDASERATANDQINITKMNFTTKTDVATVIIGKQKQPTPFLDDDRGNGVVALVPAGPVTLAAGHFTGMTTPVQYDINAFAAIGSFSGINASLWYLDVAHEAVDGYSLNINGKFGPVSVDARHSALTYNANGPLASTDLDAELTKVVATANIDALTVTAGFAMTNDDNDQSETKRAGVDLAGDDDSATNLETEHFAFDDYNDATGYLVGAAYAMGKTTIGGHYFMATQDLDNGKENDLTEIAVNASYAMSKNFKVSAVYATSEVDTATVDTDKDTLELSMKYSF